MMRLVKFGIFSLAWLCQAVFADDEIEKITLSIAAPPISPYVYLDENSQPAGILVEIFKQFSAQSNFNVQLFVLPWARALSEVKHGRMDAILPALRTEEREQFLVYPKEPLINFKSVLLKRLSDPFSMDEINAIGKDKVIAKMRSQSMGPALDQAEEHGKINVIEVGNFDQAITMLSQRKVDLVVSTKGIAQSTIDRLDLAKQVHIMEFVVNKQPSFLAFSKVFAARYDVEALMDQIKVIGVASGHPELSHH